MPNLSSVLSIFAPEQILSLRTLLASTVLTVLINLVWFVTSGVLTWITRRLKVRVKSHNFILGEGITRVDYENFAREVSGFYCLLVRHGTDDYISRMANDQERFEGRQQLKVHQVSVSFDSQNLAIFEITLPIHKSLGTQFKCFVAARSIDRVPAIIATLEKCEHVSDVKQSDSYHRDRVYFLLDRFFVVDTITAGVRNNYIFPE
jgi:hypothetical protein